MPLFLTLFHMFWPILMLMDIMDETSRYATTANDEGHIRGGVRWKPVMVRELKAFLAITMYMGMKKQPNVRSYWLKPPSIFHCSIISNLISGRRYMALTRCLHLTNPASYVTNRNLSSYDKMGQVRWMVDRVKENFRYARRLGKFITIDKMMIHYKGTYCPTRQYMPKIPQKWGIKVWCLVDSKLQYVYDFDIYCSRNGGDGGMHQYGEVSHCYRKTL